MTKIAIDPNCMYIGLLIRGVIVSEQYNNKWRNSIFLNRKCSVNVACNV